MRIKSLLLCSTLALAGCSAAWASVGAIPTSDRDLLRAVSEIVQRDRKLDALRLRLEADAGTLTVSGMASTLNLKREALRRVAGQRGVLAIVDHIAVATGDPADRTVHLRIRSRLAPHVDLRAPLFQVDVTGGIAYARGQVGTIGRLLFLDELLGGIKGVRDVDLSGVTIETHVGTEPEDKILRDAILSLLRNPYVFPVSGNIQVKVEDSLVTLSGEVPRLLDSMEAVFVAGLVAGITGVENRMEINPAYGRMRVIDFSRAAE